MAQLLFILLFITSSAFAQENSEPSDNKIIQDVAVTKRIRAAVDSLNALCNTNAASPSYRSLEQGIGYYVLVPDDYAKSLVLAGVSLQEYQQKVKSHESRLLHLVKIKSNDLIGRPMLDYQEITCAKDPRNYSVDDNAGNNKTTGWIVNGFSHLALWLDHLPSQEIPARYTRSIRYVDCLIDTTTGVYNSVNDPVDGPPPNSPIVTRFLSWANNFPGKPESLFGATITADSVDDIYRRYNKKFQTWDSLRMIKVNHALKSSPQYWKWMVDAIDEATRKRTGNLELEYYSDRYLTKKQTLDLIRAQFVRSCNYDKTPALRVMKISQLSAETDRWDLFLRSYLSTLEDQSTDSTGLRSKYRASLDELAAFNIDVDQLLTGISFRVSNVNNNHYVGSAFYLGKILARASNPDAVEQRLFSLIGDTSLDPYNRLVMINIMRSYAAASKDQKRKVRCNQQLANEVLRLPEFLRETLK